VKKSILALCLALAPSVVQAADPHDLNDSQKAALVKCQNAIQTINDLQGKKLVDGETATNFKQAYLKDTATAVGRESFTEDEFNAYLAESNKTVGFGIFLNTLIVVAGIILLLAFVGLIVFYFWPLLVRTPFAVYEVSSYALTAALLLGALQWEPFGLWFLKIQPLWFVIPGAFTFPACVMLSRALHWGGRSPKEIFTGKGEVFMGPGFVSFAVVLFGLCTLVWGGLAIAYHTLMPGAGVPYFLAFISIMALQSFLGFSVITMPGCIAMGWEKDAQVPRSTLASFILLAFYVSIKLTSHIAPEAINIFSTGCLFMGAFVYFLGLLVMSSKWYSWRDRRDKDGNLTRDGFRAYCFMQFLTVVSGFAALYFGASFGIGTLLGIGGTFFAIYLLEKYYEIPWKGVGWAWSLLGVAGGLYFFIGFASQHPEYFVWGIK
jgi:hypothetical protein